jgi:hypothetical protein
MPLGSRFRGNDDVGVIPGEKQREFLPSRAALSHGGRSQRVCQTCAPQIATPMFGPRVSNIPYGFPGRIGLTFQRLKAFFAPV